MTGKTLSEEEYDGIPWLHVYGQSGPHDSVRIIGTASGLLSLRNAIDEALQRRSPKIEAFTAVGEGYEVAVDHTNRTGLEYTALPYQRNSNMAAANARNILLD